MWLTISSGALHIGQPASTAARMFFRRSEAREGVLALDITHAKNFTQGGAWFSQTKLKEGTSTPPQVRSL
jgi:hypothetical protein